MKFKIFVCLIMGVMLLGTGLDLPAQKSKRLTKKADRKYDRYAYFKALKFYRKAAEKDATNPYINLRVADAYRHLDNPAEAAKWYEEALFYPENQGESINYLHYIRSLMEIQRYEEAGNIVDAYLKRFPGDELGTNLKVSTRDYPLFLKDSSLVTVYNLAINSPESDFGPTLNDGKVIFSSAQEKEQMIFGWNGRYFLQLYTGTIGEETYELEDVEQFRGNVNTKYHEAIVAFTPEQDAMYFTRNNFYKGKRGSNVEGATLLKIFRAEKQGKKWGKVEGIHFNSDEYSVGHPSLSSDGQIMYFTSDMPGGYGGTDIWKTEWNGEDWGKPINLGPSINTPADEMFPWISNENILYFSSEGLPGLGGLDLFSSEMQGSSFAKPKNLGAPLNSSRDDFQLVLTDDGQGGYFSSNRPRGKGDDDIYSFAFRRIQYRGLVVDKATQEPIDKASVQLLDEEKIRYFNFTDPEGIFAQGMDSLYPWEILVAKEGYQVERLQLKDATATEDGLFAKVELVPCGEGPYMEPDSSPSLVLNGVIKDTLGNPIKKGKVRIIREIDVTDSRFTANLKPGEDYIVEVETPEFPSATRTYGIPNNVTDPEVPLEAIFGPNELPPGRVFFIIYYDFDESYIRDPDARPELDRVVAFMKKYPGVKVELGSHTDSRGTDQYNVGLSNRRANEAFAYITSKGISSNRLSKAWYGERVLDQPCPDGVDCTEELHQLNRRTEFKIVGWEGGFRTGPDFQK